MWETRKTSTLYLLKRNCSGMKNMAEQNPKFFCYLLSWFFAIKEALVTEWRSRADPKSPRKNIKFFGRQSVKGHLGNEEWEKAKKERRVHSSVHELVLCLGLTYELQILHIKMDTKQHSKGFVQWNPLKRSSKSCINFLLACPLNSLNVAKQRLWKLNR